MLKSGRRGGCARETLSMGAKDESGRKAILGDTQTLLAKMVD